MRWIALTAGWLVGALSLFAACSYSPNIKSGELLCSDSGECPRGFACSGSRVCCANGDLICNAGGTGTGGSGGASGTGGRVATDFIGNWQFGTNADVYHECDDGSTPWHASLKASDGTYPKMGIAAGPGGGTNLTAAWDVWTSQGCTTIGLYYDATGAHLADLLWDCGYLDTTSEYYWTIASFDVTVISATSATHKAVYYRTITDLATSTDVNCTQTVTSSMTR